MNEEHDRVRPRPGGQKQLSHLLRRLAVMDDLRGRERIGRLGGDTARRGDSVLTSAPRKARHDGGGSS